MAKQVGELAKDLGLSLDELGEILAKLGVEGRGEEDVVEDETIDRVRVQLVVSGRQTARRKAGTRRAAPRRKEPVKPGGGAAEAKESTQPVPEASAGVRSPAKKKRPSARKLLETSTEESGQGPGVATRRLGRAVRVPTAEQQQAEEVKPTEPAGAPKRKEARKRTAAKEIPAPTQAAPAAGKGGGQAVSSARAVSQPQSVDRGDGMTLAAEASASKLIEASSRSLASAPAQPSPVEEAPAPSERVAASVPADSVDLDEGSPAATVAGAPPALRFPPPTEAPRRKKSKRKTPEEEEVRHLRRRTEPTVPAVTSVQARRGITVAEFATLIGVSPSEVVKKLVELGSMKSVTMSLTDEELELVGASLGVEVSIASPDLLRAQEEAARAEQEAGEDEGKLRPRPPVVTVMGHVDHGKTLLLDRIRRANVAEQEAGGITQHIGAYRAQRGDNWITFIDTPGHEAFTAMRARGASVTDIVVLVVAADDGVMPQTVEAISHVKAAGVPMVVAINKIDKEDADPLRVKTQLTEHGVVVEELGGSVPCAEVSAMTGQGIDELLDLILLVAELEELKANPDAPGSGVCIEAHVDPGKGPVATVLVRRGTIRRGDAFVAGLTYGRVRSMTDENGHPMESATPSVPVQVAGFEAVAEAGDDFRVVGDDKEARRIAEERILAKRQAEGVAPRVVRLEDIHEKVAAEERGRLGVILKTDTQGSLEALSDALRKLERPEVELDLVHGAVGGITENDVMLAQASEAIIIGFNVRPDANARREAAASGVEIRTYEVIYKALEDVEAAIEGLLEPEIEEVVTGTAEVRATFKVPRVGVVAGCYVQEGTVSRGSQVRLLRNGVVVYTGRIASLRRFKDDVKEVSAGFECGIGLEAFQDIKEGDVLETFEMREVKKGK